MSLQKIKDFDPNYRDHFGDEDILGYDLYAGTEKVGNVDDMLVDETGNIRYLVINTGFWVLGKQFLLPIGRAQLDNRSRRVTVAGLTRAQVEALPQYDGKMPVDYDYEEKVRGVYRPMGNQPLDSNQPVESTRAVGETAVRNHDRNTYAYDRDPALYNLDDRAHQNLRLYEERLIANKTRAKTGEVAVGKHVETKNAKVSVPIDKERVVIERHTLAGGAAVTPGDRAFQSGEVARVEVYEETPDIRKEAFVREEVNVRKETNRETVNAEETIRREELDIDTKGNPLVDKGENVSRPRNRT
ncbi:MAG: DUF2382 domain-containing protein [Oscillatoriophycideae cyanobacterium NC_groundwater_1537_Pr4_S-0.65um_50_18]|nr:DUF2382 domain-containing protein [Oscillatoriophycideae cyanobacterium NC_groundwater_1537_Pr4_S-0.65um_50_18]